jgi:hypothetical protein
MERGLKAPLSPHEESTFRRIALGISEAKLFVQRDVAYLVRLGLVDETAGKLRLTDSGRERYQGLPDGASPSDEADAALRRHLLRARSS